MLGAAAGAFVVVGVVAFVAEADNQDPTAPGVVFTLLLVAVALMVGLRGAGPLRAACVTALVLAVPLLWFFAFFGGGDFGKGELRGVYLLTLVCYAGAVPPVVDQGPRHLPRRRAAGVRELGRVRGGRQQLGRRPVPERDPGVVEQLDGLNISAATSDTTDATATVALIIGLVFLGVGAALDRRGYAGAATPFVAVGAIETLAGAIVLGGNESVLLGGLLAIAAGRGRRPGRRAR